MRFHEGALYMNDDDWVEHCSALLETPQGEFQLWHWADSQELLMCESSLSKPEPLAAPGLAKIAT